MTAREMRQKRASLVKESRDLLDLASKEERELTGEETEGYENRMAEIDRLKVDIDREENLATLEADVERSVEEPVKPEVDDETDESQGPEVRVAYDRYLRGGSRRMSREDSKELRALQVGTDSEGGYTVPDEFNKTLIQGLEDQDIMRGLATTITTSSGTMEIPVVSSHGSSEWMAEEGAFTESDEVFDQVTLSAYKLGTIIKVSIELLADSAFNLEAYLAQEFSRRQGAKEEAAFVVGDGSSKPTGVVNGSGEGVEVASVSAVTADELIDLYHSLGRPYRKNASFLMADSTVKVIRKLKDGDSQYMWQPGLQAGQPDSILRRPVQVSDNVAAIAASAKSILFADFKYYWVADRAGIVFQRLDELYAVNGQVGFLAYQRVDGKLTLAESSKHLVHPAS